MEFEPGTPLERISIRRGEEDDMMLVLESENAGPPEVEIEADISVVHLNGDDSVVMAGDDHVVWRSTVGASGVSAGSFFQVNTAMAEKMVSHLLERLPLTPDSTLTDVYCGVGLFSAFLAPRVARLIGIESSPVSLRGFCR